MGEKRAEGDPGHLAPKLFRPVVAVVDEDQPRMASRRQRTGEGGGRRLGGIEVPRAEWAVERVSVPEMVAQCFGKGD